MVSAIDGLLVTEDDWHGTVAEPAIAASQSRDIVALARFAQEAVSDQVVIHAAEATVLGALAGAAQILADREASIGTTRVLATVAAFGS